MLVTLPLAVLHARRHQVSRHRMAMLMLFTGALVIRACSLFYPAESCTQWPSALDRFGSAAHPK
jgi:uncharacterized membrane protein